MAILNMVYYKIDSGWKPGANTIAYYPLTSTTQGTDQSGNNRNLTVSNVTFGTYQGVNCGQFSGNGNLNYALTVPSEWTAMFWVYHISNNINQVAFDMGGQIGTGRYCLGYFYNPNSNKICLGQFYGGYESTTNMNITGQWAYICITYKAGSNILYINGASKITMSDTISFRNNLIMGTFNGTDIGMYGGISNVIIENRVRAAQEVADYYNQTKGQYGIS